jgi:ankyrin repeat protein
MHVLQQAGCDVNAASRQGDTPLHLAAEHGQTDAILQLYSSRQLAPDAPNMVGWAGLPLPLQEPARVLQPGPAMQRGAETGAGAEAPPPGPSRRSLARHLRLSPTAAAPPPPACLLPAACCLLPAVWLDGHAHRSGEGL